MVNHWISRTALFLLISCFAALGFPWEAHGATVKAEEIKAAILRHVEDNMHWTPGTVRVDFPARVADIEIPGKQVELMVQNRSDEEYIGNTVFSIRLYSEGILYREEKVRVLLEVLRDFLVSARFLARNQGIAADDVRVVKKWVRRIPANVLASPADVIGKSLTMDLQPDTEITRNNVKALLLVKRGSVVRILFDNGYLNVMTVGISEEDGVTDSLIRVKNATSNKTIYARVASESLVRVEF